MNFLAMAPSLESLEVKIDTILRKMEELTALQIKVVELEDDVRVLNNKVSDLNSTVAKLNNEMTLLKEKDNDRDQQSRGNAVRLFGLAAGEEEDATDPARALIKRVYDCIVKPVLTAAKANKQLDSVPSLSNTIADAYRIKGKAKQVIVGQPPPAPSPIIVKFVSPAIRLAFLRNKRASLPAPSAAEIQAGVKRYSVVEDLTSTTYKKMRELADSLEVDKVWSIDGRLRYTVPGDKTIYKVKSVFASVLEIIGSD